MRVIPPPRPRPRTPLRPVPSPRSLPRPPASPSPPGAPAADSPTTGRTPAAAAPPVSAQLPELGVPLRITRSLRRAARSPAFSSISPSATPTAAGSPPAPQPAPPQDGASAPAHPGPRQPQPPRTTANTISSRQTCRTREPSPARTPVQTSRPVTGLPKTYISSPLWGVSDVALRACKLRRGRVILSGVYDTPGSWCHPRDLPLSPCRCRLLVLGRAQNVTSATCLRRKTPHDQDLSQMDLR